MANGRENPRLMVSNRFRSCMNIIAKPITKNMTLNCILVALSIDTLTPHFNIKSGRKKALLSGQKHSNRTIGSDTDFILEFFQSKRFLNYFLPFTGFLKNPKKVLAALQKIRENFRTGEKNPETFFFRKYFHALHHKKKLFSSTTKP